MQAAVGQAGFEQEDGMLLGHGKGEGTQQPVIIGAGQQGDLLHGAVWRGGGLRLADLAGLPAFQGHAGAERAAGPGGRAIAHAQAGAAQGGAAAEAGGQIPAGALGV